MAGELLVGAKETKRGYASAAVNAEAVIQDISSPNIPAVLRWFGDQDKKMCSVCRADKLWVEFWRGMT